MVDHLNVALPVVTKMPYFRVFDVIMLPRFLYSINKYVRGVLSRLIFLSTTILHSHPASRVPMPASVPEKIRVLRTITKMLAGIPRQTPIIPKDNLEDKAWQTADVRQELKLLDAFARLMVFKHEVVAVSSNRGPSLNVVACSNTEDGSEGTEETDQDKETRTKGYIDALRDWTYRIVGVANPRIDTANTRSGTDSAILIKPKPPLDLDGRTAIQYMEALERTW